jgi:hypothetical protein
MGGVVNAIVMLAYRGKGTRRGPTVGGLLATLWLIVPPLLFIGRNTPVFHYYFLYSYPAQFVLMALLCDDIVARLTESLSRYAPSRQRMMRIIIPLVVFLPLALIGIEQTYLNWLGQNALPAGPRGSFHALHVQQTIDAARHILGERPECQLVVLGEGTIYETSQFGLLREFVGPERVRFSDAILYPAPCAVYFASTAYSESHSWLQAHTTPMPEFTVRTPVGTWMFHELSPAAHARAAADLTVAVPPGRWSNDVSMQQSSIEMAIAQSDILSSPQSAALLISTTWKIGAGFSPDSMPETLRAGFDSYFLSEEGKLARRVHFGHYLLAEDNTVVSQVDIVGLDSREWRPGDLFQLHISLPIPLDLAPGKYSLVLALYPYPVMAKIPLAEAGGELLLLTHIAWPNLVD